MENSVQAVFFFATAICLLPLLGSAHEDYDFHVEGKVYCDTCRAQFVTRLSKFMPDAKVRLECRGRENGTSTYSVEDITDQSGTYSLGVKGDHEDDDCQIKLVESSDPECAEINAEGCANAAATQISLTSNDGISSPVRQANFLGFLKKEALPECAVVFKELGIQPSNL